MSLHLPVDRTYLTPGSRVCVAVSGGADSVALLTALSALNAMPRESLGIGLSVVHVHHGLRGSAADEDASFVGQLCARLQVPLHERRVDVREHVAQTGETLEEAGRTLRYRIFDELLAERTAETILTAHTLDDQTETVLMKLLRGAFTAGLSGIYPVVARTHGRIVRPLLGTSRAQVEAFLRQTEQPWREDGSNGDRDFTRNRLRHEVLPLLRAENPSLDRALSQLAELAREEEAHWQAELGRLLPQLLLPGKPVRGGGRSVSTAPAAGSVSIEIERLRSLGAATRRRVLRAAGSSLDATLNFAETDRLLALCGLRHDPTVSGRAGGVLDLMHGLRAERTPRELRLSRVSVPAART